MPTCRGGTLASTEVEDYGIHIQRRVPLLSRATTTSSGPWVPTWLSQTAAALAKVEASRKS